MAKSREQKLIDAFLTVIGSLAAVFILMLAIGILHSHYPPVSPLNFLETTVVFTAFRVLIYIRPARKS